MLTYRHSNPVTNARVVIDTPVPLTDAQIERAASLAYQKLANAQSFTASGKNAAGPWLVMAFA